MDLGWGQGRHTDQHCKSKWQAPGSVRTRLKKDREAIEEDILMSSLNFSGVHMCTGTQAFQ